MSPTSYRAAPPRGDTRQLTMHGPVVKNRHGSSATGGGQTEPSMCLLRGLEMRGAGGMAYFPAVIFLNLSASGFSGSFRHSRARRSSVFTASCKGVRAAWRPESEGLCASRSHGLESTHVWI